MSRVAILSGACLRHDAISNVVRLQADLLTGAGHEVRVIGQHTDFRSDRRHVVFRDAERLWADDWYRGADLVLFHFGIGYRLFDALGLPHDGERVLQFHNVTPPELLDGPVRDAVLDGVDQLRAHIGAVDRVWSDSTHNTESLLALTDVDPAKVELMPLCVPWASQDIPTGPRGRRVIAVGRFLPAKGQLDLVEAVHRLSDREGLRVDLIGSGRNSDRAYLGELRRRIGELGVARHVRLRLDLSDPSLASYYRQAAVFVSTSRHEGFCVPVVEALASGCRVVCTDAGALPETVGSCGTVVPVGDVEALAGALAEALDAGPLDADERAARAVHLQPLSRDAFRARLLDAVDRLL